MKIVNLTPHQVTVLDGNGMRIAYYPPSGEVARLSTIELGTSYLPDDTPVEQVEFHHLLNPPDFISGTFYIVSLPTALASPRADFLVPYSEVRDRNGQIVGCRMLARPV